MDARYFGNDTSWTGRGCHPNLIPRLMLCSKGQKKKIGDKGEEEDSFISEKSDKDRLFAIQDLKEGDWSWEWDDGHVVHQPFAIIE